MATVRLLIRRPLLRAITCAGSQAAAISPSDSAVVKIGAARARWQSNGQGDSRRRVSVTEVVYPKDPVAREGLPVVEIYTTLGCGLCDQAVEVLRGVKRVVPHTLIKQDITDHQVRACVCVCMYVCVCVWCVCVCVMPCVHS